VAVGAVKLKLSVLLAPPARPVRLPKLMVLAPLL